MGYYLDDFFLDQFVVVGTQSLPYPPPHKQNLQAELPITTAAAVRNICQSDPPTGERKTSMFSTLSKNTLMDDLNANRLMMPYVTGL
ncbi:hypothetical protein UY3_04070 [Chelonia mydas]|uniref:Uncharacterized protein n=1 Tax=Chelonia mydas TaxID=8469 RepID=M7BLH6_CHEMY|nr:hypothetical protein UY3_04070 [Chelonia mydas]